MMKLNPNGSTAQSFGVRSSRGGSGKVSRGLHSSGCVLQCVDRPLTSSLTKQENWRLRIWCPDRFEAAGKITVEMAADALRRDATLVMKQEMQLRLDDERQQVRMKMKEQVHALLRFGAEITKMTYQCDSQYGSRAVVSPKTMKDSFSQDGSLLNIKRVHWIFSELPFATHQDVLPHRKSHMDLAVENVEREMNITWAPARGEAEESHRNCLQHVYSKILYDKKQTITKEERTAHKGSP